MHHDVLHDREGRERKARAMVAALAEFLPRPLSELSLLDVGASTGIIDSVLADCIGHVVGIDIDREAIDFARRTFPKTNLDFGVGDAMALSFPDARFDVVVCSHVYEHVPDADRLMAEIFRVLRPGGVCYFAAGNRLKIMEQHYHLPFLSVLPRRAGHIYLRLAGKGRVYHEKHLTLWGLRKLVRRFEVHDCTRGFVEAPVRYGVDYMLRPGSWRHRLARGMVRYAYWWCPSYIWLLRRPV